MVTPPSVSECTVMVAFVFVGWLVCFASWHHAQKIDVNQIPVPACAGQPVC